MSYTPSTRADWMAGGFGIFNHYLKDMYVPESSLADETAAWNACVDSFDVNRFADDIASTGARWYGITIGQNSGFYCAPNETYNNIVQFAHSKCSQRDLVANIADAMTARGIRTMVYLPSAAPDNDPVACERFEWVRGENGRSLRLAAFQLKWEAVIREWSLRWGDRISGWWLDGVFFAQDMYAFDDEPNFHSFAAALRAGNPDAALAFNPGSMGQIKRISDEEDYTAGEFDNSLILGNWWPWANQKMPSHVDGARTQVFTFLGEWWGKSPPRFPDELARGYTEFVNQYGGSMMWDVPISSDGCIPPEFLKQLQFIGRKV